MQRLALAFLLSTIGCTKEASGNPFDAAGPVTTAVPMEDESSTGEEEVESSSSSSSDEAGSSSESSSSSSSSSEGSTSPIDPTGGGQPPTGQYSHCLDAAQCVDATLCVQLQQDMMTVDGFCTTYPCANAAVDCDPAPGGTAVPMCFPMTVDGMNTTACALDCGAGQTCPTGMQCFDLGTGSICA